MDEKQYTVKEISNHFRVSRQAVYEWINDGKLRSIRLGERVRIPESALSAFIQEVKPGSALPAIPDER